MKKRATVIGEHRLICGRRRHAILLMSNGKIVAAGHPPEQLEADMCAAALAGEGKPRCLKLIELVTKRSDHDWMPRSECRELPKIFRTRRLADIAKRKARKARHKQPDYSGSDYAFTLYNDGKVTSLQRNTKTRLADSKMNRRYQLLARKVACLASQAFPLAENVTAQIQVTKPQWSWDTVGVRMSGGTDIQVTVKPNWWRTVYKYFGSATLAGYFVYQREGNKLLVCRMEQEPRSEFPKIIRYHAEHEGRTLRILRRLGDNEQ